MDELLIKLEACREARDWARGKPWPEIYATCQRGDWLAWLLGKLNPDDSETIAKTILPQFQRDGLYRAVWCVTSRAVRKASLTAYCATHDHMEAEVAGAIARSECRRAMADIIRELVPIEKWNIDVK